MAKASLACPSLACLDEEEALEAEESKGLQEPRLSASAGTQTQRKCRHRLISASAGTQLSASAGIRLISASAGTQTHQRKCSHPDSAHGLAGDFRE